MKKICVAQVDGTKRAFGAPDKLLRRSPTETPK
jgi:hypothetical protein